MPHYSVILEKREENGQYISFFDGTRKPVIRLGKMFCMMA
jgi:hypothetical protein